MNAKSMLLGLTLATPALASIDVSIAAEIRLGRVVAPPPPEVVVVEEPVVVHRGPPPWAPARFYHRHRAYYYYPGADVYYRPADRMWFYLDGREWRFGVSLPASVRVDFDRCVALTMETDRPYLFREQVRTYYPQEYFVTRVRVKEKHDNRDRDHDDDHDRGKGKKRKDR